MERFESIAILLFTCTPVDEARRKRWVAGRSGRVQRRLAGRLIRHARRIARRSGLPVYVIDSGIQQGNTFGERLAHAFSHVFDRGYRRVIAIGNDTPALTEGDLVTAAAHLERHDAVLGPSADGGAYLIGLSQPFFDDAPFAGLAWETARLLGSLERYLADRGAGVAFLPVKVDADHPGDVVAAIRALPRTSALVRDLRSVLAAGPPPPAVRFAPVVQTSRPTPLRLRAPPPYTSDDPNSVIHLPV